MYLNLRELLNFSKSKPSEVNSVLISFQKTGKSVSGPIYLYFCFTYFAHHFEISSLKIGKNRDSAHLFVFICILNLFPYFWLEIFWDIKYHCITRWSKYIESILYCKFRCTFIIIDSCYKSYYIIIFIFLKIFSRLL